MDLVQPFDAILFPADGRLPHIVSLMTTPVSLSYSHALAQTSMARVPHPEVHMEYIAEDPNLRAWHYQACNFFFSTSMVTVLTMGLFSTNFPEWRGCSLSRRST
jgi:hypothetical protein